MGLTEDQQVVVDLLVKSVSPVEQHRSEAYARIVELEMTPTFLATLIDVAYLCDENVSKLAFICVKNSIARIRGTLTGKAIRGLDQERADIAVDNLKAKLNFVLNKYLATDEMIVCKELALIIRQLCRWNYPQNWMNMHELLISKLEAACSDNLTPTCTLNIVMLTHHVFKEKSMMKLARDRNMTMQLAGLLCPYVTNLWMMDWIGRWEGGTIHPDKVAATFTPVDISLTRYLDSLLIAMYTHGPRDVHQNNELVELLKVACKKMAHHLSLMKQSEQCYALLRKNCRRLLRCIGRLFECEAMVFAFVNPSTAISPVFDYLADGKSEQIISECFVLLCSAFKSPVVNNERYMQQYMELHGAGRASKGSSNMHADDFVYCHTFEEMKARVDMELSCSSGSVSVQSLRKTSSPTKGSYHAMGNIAESLSRQATFLFWDYIVERGGLVELVEFLRGRFLIVTPEEIEGWNEEQVPAEEPNNSEIHELIGAMKVNESQIFQNIVNGILGADCKTSFLVLDSYLYLYTITYTSMANLHSSKHYITILEAMKNAINSVDPFFGKLLVFRCSRIVNAWTKRINLFEEQAKIEIFRYLLYCICCEGNNETLYNLRVQHIIPFHRLYTKTIDQPFWDVLRQGNDVTRVVSSIHSVSKIDIPTIQRQALELVCKMCLEFDSEDNNFGMHLSELINTFAGGMNDLLVTTSLLQTSLGFLNSLDWQRCYHEEYYVNSHLLRFLFHLLFRMLVIDDVPVCPATANTPAITTKLMVSVNKHSELEEDTLTLWISLLRVLPKKLDTVNQELRDNIFALFPLLVNHLSEYDSEESHGKMIVCSSSVLMLDIVTEYMSILSDYIKLYASDNAGSTETGSNIFVNIFERERELWLQLSHDNHVCIEVSIPRVQELSIQCLRFPAGDPLRQGGLRLLSMLMFRLSRLCVSDDNSLFVLHKLMSYFCRKLDEGSKSNSGTAIDVQRSKLSCLSNGHAYNCTNWQHSKLEVSVLESLGGIIPILCRWAFDSPQSFNDAFINTLEKGSFASPETLMLSLIHASNQFSSNAYLRLGAMNVCCVMAMAIAPKYKQMKLFLHFKKPNAQGTEQLHSEDAKDSPHKNFSGVYLPCYMLRLVNSIISLFVESRRAYSFSITTASIMKDIEDYTLPPSKRYNLLANASSTYESTSFPISQLHEQDLFYGALKSAIQTVVRLSKTLEAFCFSNSMELLLEEREELNPKIGEIVTEYLSNNNSYTSSTPMQNP